MLVPEEERAESEVLPKEYEEARRQGMFSSAAGMARIDHVLDGKLFAAIRVDDQGNRMIEFCQQYDGGEFSPKVTVSQADLRFAAMNNFVPDGIPVPRMKARLGKFLEQVTTDYFGRVPGGTVYPPIDILSALVTVIDQLPEFRANGDGWTAETLYAAVMDMVNGVTTPPITPFGYHKAFMAFADFQIEAMAQHLEMKSGRELLKLLDQCSTRLVLLPIPRRVYCRKITRGEVIVVEDIDKIPCGVSSDGDQEQKLAYRDFINVLSAILVKYAAEIDLDS